MLVRRKSKQAIRHYKNVQTQLENLETSVRDRCKKEFTGTSQLQQDNIRLKEVSNILFFLQIWWQRWWICPVTWLAQGYPSWSIGPILSAFSFLATKSRHWDKIWMFQKVVGKLWSMGSFSYPTCSTANSFSPRSVSTVIFDIGDGQLIQLYSLNVYHNWFSSISYFVRHFFHLCFSHFSVGFSKFTPTLAQVHSHTGAPADFLSKGSGLCCLSAHSCTAWQTGVLHRHPEDVA